jgi:hypothetical protein
MITERDVAILRFINQFGFCEMPHLDQRFGLKKPRNYGIVNKLQKAGLVIHEHIFHQRHGIYRLSREGAALTTLPPLKKVPIAIYNHEILLIQLYFKLMETYPDSSWVSERELVWDAFCDGVGKKGHLADGVLILKDGKRIAIELELSLKGRYRLEKILKSYAMQFHFDEIWYFCDAKVIPTMKELTVNKPHIKILKLSHTLNAKS